MSSLTNSQPAVEQEKLLFDISGIDLSARVRTRKQIAEINPHRKDMALLDAIVWQAEDMTRAVGVKAVRDDEFWVPGHFPGQPMFPGVLQVETGAQLACYQFNGRKDRPTLAVFLRIETVVFRSQVVPGDMLYILCQDVKFQRRRFVCDLQGVVDQRIVFEGRITGMALGERQGE